MHYVLAFEKYAKRCIRVFQMFSDLSLSIVNCDAISIRTKYDLYGRKDEVRYCDIV